MPIRRQGAQEKIAKNKRERDFRETIFGQNILRDPGVFLQYVIYEFGWIWRCTSEIRRCAGTEIMRV
jgi:hypothetical protein